MIDLFIQHPIGAYLLCGLLFMIFLEIANDALGQPEQFDWQHRAVIVALWPVFVVIFIISILRN